MIVKPQKVQIRWNGKHKKYYEDKGYEYSGQNTYFFVDVDDLSHGSHCIVKVKCDYCGKTFEKIYDNYIKEMNRSDFKKACCEECVGKKLREKYGTENTEDGFEIEVESNKNELNGYSRDFLIDKFYRFIDEYGYIPSKAEFKSTHGCPGESGYNKIWGNWTNFLIDIGELNDSGWYVHDEQILKRCYNDLSLKLKDINELLYKKRSLKEIQDKAKYLNLGYRSFYIIRNYNTSSDKIINSSLQGIVDLYNDFGKCPTVYEYDEYAELNGLYRRRTIENLIGKSYSNLCIEMFENTNKNSKTKDELLKDLINLKNKLGRTPLSQELKNFGIAEHKQYRRKFGMTYNELIKSLGWKLSSNDSTIRDDEELLNDFLLLYKKINRLPLIDDIDKNKNMASYSTYMKHFGSLQNICELLNIDYKNYVRNLGSGFTCIDKNGDICRSESELKITNLLIDNHVIFEKEIPYKRVNKLFKRPWVMDWYIDGLIVEYFGLFQESQLRRNNKIGRYSRKVKRKLEKCKELKVKIIDIYPDDLTNNYNGLINKFKKHDIYLKLH